MNKANLVNYRSYNATFLSADHGTISCEGIGDLKVNDSLTLTDCLFSKDISMNLISESQLCKLGYTTQTTQTSKIVKRNRQVVLSAKEVDGLYIFRLQQQRVLATSHARTEMFHRRMGHLNLKSLRLLSHLCDGVVLDKDPQETCPVCAQAKAHKLPFPNSTSVARRIGELTHADICHVGVEDTMGKCKMFLLLVDDASRFMTLYPIKFKDDSEDIIKSYDKKMYIKTGRHLGTLRSDNGGEFINAGLAEYFSSNGTSQQLSTPYTPQQNGRAERPNRTILEGISAMLLDAKLPWSYWALAAECFVYLKNRSPHAALYKSTPYQEWFRRVPDLTNIRVFGYPCYVYIPAEVRKKSGPGHKLLPKAIRMIFVGYSDKQKAWRCYNPDTKQLVCSSSVEFDSENKPWDFGKTAVPEMPLLEFSTPLNNFPPDAPLDQGEAPENDREEMPLAPPPLPETGEDIAPEAGEDQFSEADAHNSESDDNDDPYPDGDGQPEEDNAAEDGIELDKVYKTAVTGKWKYVNPDSQITKWDPRNLPEPGSKRTRTTVIPQNPAAFLAFLDEIQNDSATSLGHILAADRSDSPTYSQAMMSPEKDKWQSAISGEYTSLFEKQVFGPPCELPKGYKTLDTKMVLKLKEPEGLNAPRRFKARLCARGFGQEEGTDYEFTFAPVAAYNSLRLFVTMLASLNYEVDTVDVKSAFLHSVLKEEIYIQVPDGYPNADALRRKGMVLQLWKCLYGLKQSPREWNNDLDSFLKSLDFKPCPSEPCIYVKAATKQYLLVYVDDIIIGTRTQKEMTTLKGHIHSRFPITDKGPISIFLNMSFTRDRAKRVFYISQPSKIDKLLEDSRLDSEELRLIRTPTNLPASPTSKLTASMCPASDEEKRLMTRKPYKSVLGQVLFIAVTCRPDIATAVSCCGQFAQNPGLEHWKALLQIVAYLVSTSKLVLRLGGHYSKLELTAYSDADWGGDLDKRRSRTGLLVLLGVSPVIWMSKLQPSVALSSTEAEYIALSLCCRDVLWARGLLHQLGFQQEDPTPIYEDNMSCIKIAESRKQAPGVKHVDIRYHFVRDEVERKTVTLRPLPTAEMVADTLTKSLPAILFSKHRESLGLLKS